MAAMRSAYYCVGHTYRAVGDNIGRVGELLRGELGKAEGFVVCGDAFSSRHDFTTWADPKLPLVRLVFDHRIGLLRTKYTHAKQFQFPLLDDT